MVCLHLEGRRLNGKLVESSWTSVAPPCLEAGRTPEFPALGEAVLGMRAGGRREIIVPPSRSAFQPDFRSFLIDLDGFRMDLRGFPHDFAGIYHDLHRFPGFFAQGMNRLGVEELMTYILEVISVSPAAKRPRPRRPWPGRTSSAP